MDNKLPAGKYYIGDLCYVMDEFDWSNCCELFFPGKNNVVEGMFKLHDGRRFASFNTGGDGGFYSNIGTKHSVDSGSIGCILVEDIHILRIGLGAG
jgi:hypothetical protein